jgi:heptose I phosphotransferase
VTRQDVTDEWRRRFDAIGMPGIGALLENGPDRNDLPGRWESLSKPGLGGRERWRWEVPNGDATGRPEACPTLLFLKRYTRVPLRLQWDRMLRQSPRHSRAYWEYQQARRLADASIPAPRPVGYAEHMRGHLERCSAVVLERVAGEPFDAAWRRAIEQRAPITVGRARHDLAVRLGRFIAAFHGTGLCHRDLYLCHVFVDLDSAARWPPALAVIDLARTHAPRWRRMRWVIKDLAQLDASGRQVGAARSDRYRTLLAYLGLQRKSPRARWYARRIVRKSDWIVRREQRKSRTE